VTVNILHVHVRAAEVMRYDRFAHTLVTVYCTHDHMVRTRDICFTLPIANFLKKTFSYHKKYYKCLQSCYTPFTMSCLVLRYEYGVIIYLYVTIGETYSSRDVLRAKEYRENNPIQNSNFKL